MTEDPSPEEFGYDRPGFLTKNDREFLTASSSELSDGTKNEKRRRIRQRTRSAFRDFSLLFEHLDKKDVELIFEDYERRSVPERVFNRKNFRDHIIDSLAFVCYSLAIHTTVVDNHRGGHRIPLFEDTVSNALDRAYKKLGLVFLDVSFEVSSAEKDELDGLKKELIQRSERDRGEIWIPPEIAYKLIKAQEIDPENLREFIIKELGKD
jgi:hypothetical protein